MGGLPTLTFKDLDRPENKRLKKLLFWLEDNRGEVIAIFGDKQLFEAIDEAEDLGLVTRTEGDIGWDVYETIKLTQRGRRLVAPPPFAIQIGNREDWRRTANLQKDLKAT